MRDDTQILKKENAANAIGLCLAEIRYSLDKVREAANLPETEGFLSVGQIFDINLGINEVEQYMNSNWSKRVNPANYYEAVDKAVSDFVRAYFIKFPHDSKLCHAMNNFVRTSLEFINQRAELPNDLNKAETKSMIGTLACVIGAALVISSVFADTNTQQQERGFLLGSGALMALAGMFAQDYYKTKADQLLNDASPSR